MADAECEWGTELTPRTKLFRTGQLSFGSITKITLVILVMTIPVFFLIELALAGGFTPPIPDQSVILIILGFVFFFLVGIVLASILTAIIYRVIVRMLPLGHLYLREKNSMDQLGKYTFRLNELTFLSLAKIITAITIVHMLLGLIVESINSSLFSMSLLKIGIEIAIFLIASVFLIILQFLLVLPVSLYTPVGKIRLEHGSKKKALKGQSAKSYYEVSK
ncbi:MAG: hypothetical protein AAGI14_12165 [Pseudomonadota bacterium]